MSVKLLYQGPLWDGSTSLQRLDAFARCEGVTVIPVDTGARVGGSSTLWRRLRWKLRWPVDSNKENRQLVDAAAAEQPDVVFVDNSRVISRRTIGTLRRIGIRKIVYYTPDDIVSKHNLSLPLKHSLKEWDLLFTTKTFNISELRALNVRRPVLVGKSFDSLLHRPLTADAVGQEFERFDLVFIGSYEEQRCRSINAVADAGFSVVVYGAGKGGWQRARLRPNVELRSSVFARDYCVAWHTGKVAMCFLRKLNRDRITQRSMEIAAIGRAMLAEKTDEHDQHFTDGIEYLGFSNDTELVSQARRLVGDKELRRSLGANIRRRCEFGGYSTTHRAQEMLSAIQA